MSESQLKYRILIIDNNALTCSTLKSILEDTYEVIAVSSVEEAKTLVLSPDSFSLLLISLHLPLNEGISYLKSLYTQGYLDSCKVMMTSNTLDDEDTMELAYKWGCCEYLHSPFIPSITKKRVEQAITLLEAQRLRSYDSGVGVFTKYAFLHKINRKGLIAYCRIQNFSNYNLKYGFIKGNELLRYTASLLRDADKNDIVGYFGHDDFGIFSENINLSESLEEISKKLRDITLDVNLSLTAGIYRMDYDAEDAVTACFKAYLAYKSMKGTDKNTCSFYNPVLYQSIINDNYIVENLFDAIRNNDIQIYYQSIVRASTRKILSKEALARWSDKQKGNLDPDRFIKIFEKNKIIHHLDKYVFEHVCMDYELMKRQGNKVQPTSLNLSLYDFVLCDMVGFIEETIQKYNIPKHLIEFEINADTNTNIINDVIPVLAQLSDLGYVITLDNFGRGNYSIDLLAKFKNIVKSVKISLENLENFSLAHQSLVSFSIEIIKSMGFMVIAKGVENSIVADTLVGMGCDKVQGFYYDKPQDVHSYLVSCAKVGIEDKSLQSYYDQVGRINLISHKSVKDYVELDDVLFEGAPIVIIEQYKGVLRFLHVSNTYREYLNGAGISDLDFVYKYVNTESNGFKKKILETVQKCKDTGTLQPLLFKTDTLSLSLTIKFVAEGEEREAYAIVINSIARGVIANNKLSGPVSFNDLASAYNRIDLIHFDTGFVENIHLNKAVFDSSSVDGEGLPDNIAKIFPANEIYPGDRDRYFEMLNYKKIQSSVWNSPKGYLKDYFRIKGKDGQYIVKVIVVNLKIIDGVEVGVCCIRDVDIMDVSINNLQKITNYLYKLPVSFSVLKVDLDEKKSVKDIIFEYANEKCAESFHLTPELIVGKSFYDIIGGNDREWARKAYQCAYEDKSIQEVLYNPLLNQWLLFNLSPVGVRGYNACTYQNISEVYSKTAELNLGVNTNDTIIRCARTLHENKKREKAIGKILDILGQTIKADRIYYLEISDNKLHYKMEWKDEKVSEICNIGESISIDRISYWQKYLLKDSYVDIEDISVIKDRDSETYEKLINQKVRSVIAIPLYADGKIVAYIGADNCANTESVNSISVLQSVGYFVSSYLDNKELVHKFEVLGLHDNLTGVKNRTSMMKDIEMFMSKSQRVGVLYADINGLKAVNDNHGHSAGDMLIKNGTKLLTLAFGKNCVYRIGGDEFVVFYCCESKEEFNEAVRLFEDSLNKNSTVSMAVGTQWCEDSTEIKIAMHEADEKMYYNKAEYYKEQNHDRRSRR